MAPARGSAGRVAGPSLTRARPPILYLLIYPHLLTPWNPFPFPDPLPLPPALPPCPSPCPRAAAARHRRVVHSPELYPHETLQLEDDKGAVRLNISTPPSVSDSSPGYDSKPAGGASCRCLHNCLLPCRAGLQGRAPALRFLPTCRWSGSKRMCARPTGSGSEVRNAGGGW